MDTYQVVIHIVETPRGYSVWYNGELVADWLTLDEVRGLRIGDLADTIAMCDLMCQQFSFALSINCWCIYFPFL